MKAWPHWRLFATVMQLIVKRNQYVERYVFFLYIRRWSTFTLALCTYPFSLPIQLLKDVLPRQQFVTVIQAKADGKIVASERIQAYRKDVLTKSGKTVGGGDQTRKMKLLEKKKKGKERMQQTGRVSLSQEAFNSVISRSS